MTAPSEIPSRRPPARPATRRRDALELETLRGPARLERSPHGHLELQPRPTPEALATYYREAFYQQDHASYLSDKQAQRDYWDAIWSIRRELMEAVLAPTARRLLDVGCGGGFLLDHFRTHGWSVTGIEPSPSAVAWARDQLGLEVVQGELLDLEPPGSEDPAAFDAIHCAQVLEHVLDPVACVERIASLLRPGGVAFIEIPNDFSVLQEVARARLDKPAWWVAPGIHLNYFDGDSLPRLLARRGLEEIDRIASFPMELFLLMGDDYVGRPEVGRTCHAKRMAFETAMIEGGRRETLARLYRSLAAAGMGRTLGLLVRKEG
ncbi:MAG: class I SAM-dependent methyltransferase [Myxococcota bacterium]